MVSKGYNLNKNQIDEFLSELSKNLDDLTISYDNLVVIGDFNSEVEEKSMIDFCETYRKNLIKDFTCPTNPSCIALILHSIRALQTHHASLLYYIL